MSEGDVVRRNPKNNRRKNTDGYRTDSGCFEDVDVHVSNHHSPTSDSPSSESVAVERDIVATSDHSSEESRHLSEHAGACPTLPSLADECVDDKDFHALLKRLADITNNPEDLYRLCFSSRLSFCGHVSGNTEDEGFFVRTAEEAQNDKNVAIEANKCTNCKIPEEVKLESVEKHGGRASNGQQCVELLSLLSSFMVKAKENPGVFNHSSLGNSLVGQLSSLLSTLEEAKKNPSEENESHPIAPGQQAFSTNPQPSSPTNPSPTPECIGPCRKNEPSPVTENLNTAIEKMDFALKNSTESQGIQLSFSNQKNCDKTLSKTPVALLDPDTVVTDGKADFTLNNSSVSQIRQTQNYDPMFISTPAFPCSNAEFGKTHSTLNNVSKDQNKKLLLSKSQRQDDIMPASEFKTLTTSTDFGKPNMTLRNSSDRLNRLPSSSSQTEELETSLPVSNITTSSAKTHLSAEIDKSDLTPKDLSDSQDEHLSLLNHGEDNDRISDLTEPISSTSSVTDADDVVTSGRRAVKPYSWDYGDIWEKELERAKSSESFQNGTEEGRDFAPRKDPGKDLMPSFEEIRDELFHNAGFIYDNGCRSDGAKRRSRSADARSTLQDDGEWPEYHNTQSDMHSPFVRTVYQNEAKPSSGLRRSWSSHHIGGNSFMVNVDWTHGRQMRVISGSTGQYQGFDDVRAQIIKEAVVKTSTFRGSKPWSVLKRRPSGLRRRSAGNGARNQSLSSNTSDESRESTRGDQKSPRARSDHDSESSDSPYVSATSYDCLTTATDDSSSVTSSQYYAASSLPSTPSVSNRNSACFSDTSTSDASDIRRVVFQSSPSESVPRELYTRGFDTLTARGMSLDQRFGYIQKHDRVALNEGLETNSLKGSLVKKKDLQNGDSENLRVFPSALAKKWHGDRLISPLLVRSESDLNRLTKVQFVGDSYSRSRISKNVRYTRNRSESPSPVGPRSAHTRVVSCEIVQSDNRKRDVYTKVKIAEPLNDEEAKIPNGRSTKLGHPSTRRSWHGQSPTRSSARHSPNNKNITPVNGTTRYPSSSNSMQERQIRRSQVENHVQATFVAVDNHQQNMRSHWSTGSLRLGASERPRLWSDSVVMNRRHGYQTMNCNVHPNFERNFNAGRGSNNKRAQAIYGPSSDAGTRSGRRRSPPDYMTAIKYSEGLQRRRNQSCPPGNEKHLESTNKGFSTGRNLPLEMNRFQSQPKDHMEHIVKETSFVGPSTFTKYQSSSTPSFSRTRRSRSLNERDTMSRRRLHDSDVYRRRAMEISQSNHNYGEYVNQLPRCDSDITAVRRSERSRRYSEGATRHPARHDVAVSECVVDVSYCDPRRESIREGTYSIVNAESARNGEKSDEPYPAYQAKRRDHTPIPRPRDQESITIQNSCKTEHGCSFNDFNQGRKDRRSNASTKNDSSGKGTPVIALHNGCETQQGRSFNDFDQGERHEINETFTEIVRSGQGVSVDQKKIVESKCKQVEFAKRGVGVSPVLHHEDVDGITLVVSPMMQCRKVDETSGAANSSLSSYSDKDQCGEVVSMALPNADIDGINLVFPPIMECKKIDAVNPSTSSHGNINQSELSPSLPNQEIGAPYTVLSPVSLNRMTDEATAVISAQELLFENTDETKIVVSSRLAYTGKDENASNDSHPVVSYKQSDEASEYISVAKLKHRNRTTSSEVIYQRSPYGRQDMTDTTVSARPLPYKQIDEVDVLVPPLSRHENVDGRISVISSYAKQGKANTTSTVSQNTLPCKQVDEGDELVSSLSQYKKVDERTTIVSPVLPNKKINGPNVDCTTVLRNRMGDSLPIPNQQQQQEDTVVVLSPVLPNRKAHDKTNEVNVFIDYRNKRPVSVEFADEEVSFLRNFGSTSRTSTKEKQNGGDEKAGRSNKSYTARDVDLLNHAKKNAKNEVETTRPRLSRRDRHEQAVLSKSVKNLQNEQQLVTSVSIHQPSPKPYRRDSTIIYTDARTSFGSDTDSISRDSTISSSGSDMTVILHDDMDISIDDLRQLTESGSKIGIEIAEIEVGTGDELLESRSAEKMPPAMEISKNFTNYPKRVPDNAQADSGLVLPKETLKEKAHSPPKLNKNKTPKLVINGHELSSRDNLETSSYNVQSSCSSIASSRASSKSTGTEDCSKGKYSPNTVESGKGFFSRLKSFRNSFRGKKLDSNSPEKSGKKSKNSERNVKGHERLCDRSETMSTNFPATDGNANVVSNSRIRTKSDARVESSEGTTAKSGLSRRSYDVFRQPNNSLRSVVGVKSVSSDHLNAYRVNNTPFMNEITAKSLEVLVETCI